MATSSGWPIEIASQRLEASSLLMSLLGQARDRIPLMIIDPNALLFALRDRGRVVTIAKMGETIYELDGKRYRTFLVPEKDRRPGEGPWRAEEVLQGESIE